MKAHKHWVYSALPRRSEPWLLGKPSNYQPACDKLSNTLQQAVRHHQWRGPQSTIYFIADPHADAEAFNASLIAGGCGKPAKRGKIQLNRKAKAGLIIIGGDCLDKGPSNLALLRAIKHIKQQGAKIKLLAGNHDLRLLMGLRSLEQSKHLTSEHFFIRMGPKVVPLLKEVFEHYITPADYHNLPSAKHCRQKIYPSPNWLQDFPQAVGKRLPPAAIEKECNGIRKKLISFEQATQQAGMTMQHVYAAAKKCQQLFFQPDGEFYWFFSDMQLAYRSGSFLFVHAGVDDNVCQLIAQQHVRQLNRRYRKQLKHDLFSFYYGSLANSMRTKYREIDWPLSDNGVKHLYHYGIHAVVHGHRNRCNGQQLRLRQGLLHIECDVTLDRNSRRKEGMNGIGAGITIIQPCGNVQAISVDHPYIKRLEPNNYR